MQTHIYMCLSFRQLYLLYMTHMCVCIQTQINMCLSLRQPYLLLS